MKCSETHISPYTDGLSGILLIKKALAGNTSGCVGLHRFPGEVIAFDEHFIDFVNGLRR